ncbi:hypothetical protein ACQKDS_05365 [Serratia sp. NPDC078593]|uniref:hypothetical protein n=1 Tax=unclassified Serratia (in: enterobacteria) TaxID=2647522 RepID=UPI0037D78C90
MGRSTSRQSRVRRGKIRSAILAKIQYWKMYAVMKLRRIRIPTALMALTGALVSFFVLGLLMLSVVAIDIITTLLLLCRKVLGRGRHHGNAFMPRS